MQRNEAKEAAAAPTPARKLIVVKRKKPAVRSKSKKKASGALPTFARGRRPTVSAAPEPPVPATDEAQDALDEAFAALPNDCHLGIQFFQQDPQCAVEIPLSSNAGLSIKGVLECHLYQRLQDSNRGDTVVSRDIHRLLKANTIRTLSSPSRGEATPLQIILFTSDYERAVRDSVVNEATATATEWLLAQLAHLTSQRIARGDFEERWSKSPLQKIGQQNLEHVLAILVRQQVLLGSPLEGTYQLWLPSWGLVLKAWEKARKLVLLQLKRSSYKERSIQALEQTYSPISTSLLLTWMESVGQVEMIERPAGKYVRLPAEEEE